MPDQSQRLPDTPSLLRPLRNGPLHEDQRGALEWIDVCPPTYEASPTCWIKARQDVRQFSLRPHRTTCLPRSRAAARCRSLEDAFSTSSSATSASARRIAHPSILCGHESKVTVLRERLAEVSGDRAQIASAMAFPTSSVRAAPPMSGVWGPKARIFSMAAKTASPASGCPR